jgi:hypothetical protein
MVLSRCALLHSGARILADREQRGCGFDALSALRASVRSAHFRFGKANGGKNRLKSALNLY